MRRPVGGIRMQAVIDMHRDQRRGDIRALEGVQQQRRVEPAAERDHDAAPGERFPGHRCLEAFRKCVGCVGGCHRRLRGTISLPCRRRPRQRAGGDG